MQTCFVCILIMYFEYIRVIPGMALISNYNRTNDEAGWQPTPITADVTGTNIAGYVRVRILMNR